MAFSKMHGLGNDFMVINNLDQQWSPATAQIVAWADRHFGIGFDQLLVVEPASDRGQVAGADFSYRIFNADGREVEQCGNGLRCFARYVHDQGLTDKTELCVETMAGIYYPQLGDQGLVTVDMGQPNFEPAKIPFNAATEALDYSLPINQTPIKIAALSLGNPHAVTLVDNIDTAPVARVGPLIARHADFPQGVNAGFMQVVDRQNIKLRVFERGVGETLACGSGACAAAVAAMRWQLTDRRVTVHLSGGELQIEWLPEQVRMSGPATHVYHGTLDT
ncbi:MAG: diaminopimelate epimerase [Immundisolibacteraceae bacterium]|nr:diaminopimelate epimerase [Immundisolibacteraceae bacterium]